MVWLCGTIFLLLLFGSAHAALTTIGTAQFEEGGAEYNLIWDDDNNGKPLIWLDYTNEGADWDRQMSWAQTLDAALTYDIGSLYAVDLAVGSWRLPSPGSEPIPGFNITTSEMGHLFTNELGLQSHSDIGAPVGPEITPPVLQATIFDELIASSYWANKEWVDNTGSAWHYNFTKGSRHKR